MLSYEVELGLRDIVTRLNRLPLQPEVRNAIRVLLEHNVGRGVPIDTPLPATAGPLTRRDIAATFYKGSMLRESLFGPDLFFDPIWLIMLDLFVGMEDGRPTTIGAASAASRVPATTALRTLKHMEDRGLVTRREKRGDTRRVFVEPTDLAMRSVTAVIDQVASKVVVHP